MSRNRRVVIVLGSIAVVAAIGVLALSRSGDGPPARNAVGQTTVAAASVGEDGDESTTTTVPASETTVGNEPGPTGNDEADDGEPTGGDTATPSDTLPEATGPDAGESGETSVPLGSAIEVGLWRIGVSGAELAAAEVITEYVDFNSPPADGNQFVLIELSGVYLGSGTVDPVFDWELVTADGDEVETAETCGVVPDSIYDLLGTESGGHFRANVCFEVAESDIAGGVFLTLGLVSGDGQPYFFALD